ncbi:unnamed protein product [Sphagnum balticum]
MQALVPALKKALLPATQGGTGGVDTDYVSGVAQIEELVVIDQSPIGRTSRSNPATYLGIFDEIRALYASLPESNATWLQACKGLRYNAQTLEITYKGKHIADILAMTAQEALVFFDAHHRLKKRLQLLCDVGLDYIQLGQDSTTLSGGEAQRIKLVDELAKRGSKNALYSR